jgi:hypothetical protein
MTEIAMVSPNPSASSPMTEREWDKLTNLVLERCVVPVIGPELLTWRDDGEEQSLYSAWGRELASQAGLTFPVDACPALYEIANELSLKQNSGDLTFDIDDVIRRRPWPVPDALNKLAEISSFSLYVTTTIDHLFEKALRDARGEHQHIDDIVFTPRGVKSRIDLPNNFGPTSAPVLYHLFGSSSPVTDSFAKTEDDLIEYSWSLLDQQYSPDNLYDYLQKKTVLLLGCSFPDWLGRFFIHALNGRRHEETINIYYVSHSCEVGLCEFLKRRRAKVVTSGSAIDFVTNLHQRWQQRSAGHDKLRNASPDLESEFKSGTVFLSYASENRDRVRKIREQLEAANIDTWMDERALQPGVDYEQSIRENIRRASFFVAVISRAFDQPSRAVGGYVLKEWKWAENAAMERHKEDAFLQPLVIDDTPAGAGFVDSPYRELHWTRLRDGKLPPEFIDFLSRGIRKYRRAR